MTEPLDLDAIESRERAATAGPWRLDSHPVVLSRLLGGDDQPIGILDIGAHAVADREFVIAARTDVPLMAAEIRRLRAVVEAAEHVHGVLHGLIEANQAPGVRARGAWDALGTALIAARSIPDRSLYEGNWPVAEPSTTPTAQEG